MRNRAWLIGIIALGLALIGWAVFGRETDEEVIRRRLIELSAALAVDPSEGLVARGLRLRGDVPEYVVADAVFDVPEVGGEMSRNGAIAAAVGAATRWPAARIGWSDVVVTLDGRGGARVEGTAELSRRDESGARSTERHVTMTWKKDGTWKVASVDAVTTREGTDDE